MRLIVVSTGTGNCFRPEFGSSLRLVQAASELSPSPYSRHELLRFYRKPPDVEVFMGSCAFARTRWWSKKPTIVWSDPGTRERFMPAGSQCLKAERFAPGDEIVISLHPKEQRRSVRNFWFLYWLHITGWWSHTRDKLYQ